MDNLLSPMESLSASLAMAPLPAPALPMASLPVAPLPVSPGRTEEVVNGVPDDGEDIEDENNNNNTTIAKAPTSDDNNKIDTEKDDYNDSTTAKATASMSDDESEDDYEHDDEQDKKSRVKVNQIYKEGSHEAVLDSEDENGSDNEANKKTDASKNTSSRAKNVVDSTNNIDNTGTNAQPSSVGGNEREDIDEHLPPSLPVRQSTAGLIPVCQDEDLPPSLPIRQSTAGLIPVCQDEDLPPALPVRQSESGLLPLEDSLVGVNAPVLKEGKTTDDWLEEEEEEEEDIELKDMKMKKAGASDTTDDRENILEPSTLGSEQRSEFWGNWRTTQISSRVELPTTGRAPVFQSKGNDCDTDLNATNLESKGRYYDKSWGNNWENYDWETNGWCENDQSWYEKDKNDEEEKHEKKPRDRRHGVMAFVNGQMTYTGSLPRDSTGLSKPKQETADQDSTRNAGDLKGTTKNNDYERSSSSGNNKGNYNWKKYDDHDNYKDNKGYKNNDWKNQKKDDWKSDKEWKDNSNAEQGDRDYYKNQSYDNSERSSNNATDEKYSDNEYEWTPRIRNWCNKYPESWDWSTPTPIHNSKNNWTNGNNWNNSDNYNDDSDDKKWSESSKKKNDWDDSNYDKNDWGKYSNGGKSNNYDSYQNETNNDKNNSKESNKYDGRSYYEDESKHEYRKNYDNEKYRNNEYYKSHSKNDWSSSTKEANTHNNSPQNGTSHTTQKRNKCILYNVGCCHKKFCGYPHEDMDAQCVADLLNISTGAAEITSRQIYRGYG